MTPIKELEKLRMKILDTTLLNKSWERKVQNQPLELLITGQYKEVCLKIEDENEQILELTVEKGSITLKQKREEIVAENPMTHARTM